MKKNLVLLLGILTLSARAADLSTTVVIASGGMSNLVSTFAGSALVTSVSLQSGASTTANVTFVDNNTNNMYFTNAAYIGVTTYPTNYYDCYTNFLGRTNCITNLAIIDITNTVAEAAVVATKPIVYSVGTNTSTILYGNWFFNRGIWATNSGNGNATVTITYRPR